MNVKELNMEELQNQLKSEPAYVQSGDAYQLVSISSVSIVNGKFALVYSLGEKISRDGKPYEPKKRAPRATNGAAATPPKPTGRR